MNHQSKMHLKKYSPCFFSLVLAALLWGCSADHKDQPEKAENSSQPPNIVFFLVDDLGWTDLGCYGSSFYETPNVDSLAQDGVRFTSAYATCHVCSPSRASILSGKYPARLHLTDWLPGRKDYPFQELKNADILQHLPYEELTLAEALKEDGYSTGIFGKWHLGEDPYGPLEQGFDVQVPDWNKGWPLTYYAPFRLPGLEGKEGEYLTDRLTDEALKFIDTNSDHPFFLYLSHFAVHDPIEGREDLVNKYSEKLPGMHYDRPPYILEGNPDGSTPITIEERTSLLEDPAYAGYDHLPRETVKVKQRQDNVQFAAMVESMDNSLGRIRKKLRELNLTDNTIIVFFSDNGGMAAANFGNPDRKIDPEKLNKAYSTAVYPLRGAKGWMYEGGIRVPLIIQWPGHGEHGTVSDAQVIGTDLYPTLLDMAGLPAHPEQTVDGKSLVPVLQGEKIDRKALYWHFPHYSNHGMQSPGGAIRTGDYKLLEYYVNGHVQLYNIREDPGELHDLASEMPDKALELKQMLHTWRDSVNAQMMPPNPEYQDPQ